MDVTVTHIDNYGYNFGKPVSQLDIIDTDFLFLEEEGTFIVSLFKTGCGLRRSKIKLFNNLPEAIEFGKKYVTAFHVVVSKIEELIED